MKKIFVVLLALVMALSIVTLVACNGSETFTGSFSYEAYGTTYGAKVDVVMTDGVISNLKLYTDEETGWVGLSDAYPDYGWTDESRQVWLDAVNNLMISFVGLTADDVAGINATIAGVNAVKDSVDSEYNVSGATQSSARLVLAIQNAICDGPSGATEYESGTTYTGSASGTIYGTAVEFEVSVNVDNGTIISVTLEDGTHTTDGFTAFDEGIDDALAAFEGMAVADVLALDSSAGGDTVVTGATMSSSVLLDAVKDALSVFAPPAGTAYQGTSTGTVMGNNFTVKVTVYVDNGVVTGVLFDEDSETNFSWTSYVTDEALATLAESFVGMTVVQALVADTTDGFISNATVTSNTVLLAVQDALGNVVV